MGDIGSKCYCEKNKDIANFDFQNKNNSTETRFLNSFESKIHFL